MSLFSLSLEAARTSLLLALFLALLVMLALVFTTFNNKAKRTWWIVNAILFLGFFMLLVILCTEHNYIADGIPLIFCSSVPIRRLWCAVVALFLYAVCGVALERRRRAKSINHNSIKEALDTLPVAICYFMEQGMVKLCNLQMYRLFHALSQSDLQSLKELHSAIDGCDLHTGVMKLSGDEPVFLFPNGKAWLFTEDVIRFGARNYTETVFYDVTELYEKRVEIEAQTNMLRALGRNIRKLSENVVAATKEEEMLSFKTVLHDRMGAGLVAARQALQNRPTEELDILIHDWKRSVSLVKRDNDTLSDRGELPELILDAETIGVQLCIEGALPPDSDVCDIFLSAMRECLTNCVRHADATALWVKVSGDASNNIITVTNNGVAPQAEIVPRGGLSNLTKRAGRLGGTAQIQSFPVFMLTVSIPKNRGFLQ